MTTRTFLRVVGAASLLALFAGGAFAHPLDKRTTFTFSAPVTIPGVTLPAGSYLFRIANESTSQNVAQVLSADGKTPYAMFFVEYVQRFDLVKDAEVRFMETGPGMTPAIKTWWYPGYSGYNLVYPHDQAEKLAKGVVAEPIRAAVETPAETKAPEYVWVEPEAAPLAPVHEATIAAAPPAPEREVLPKTDSPTASVVLLGLVALMTGGLVRRWRTTRL